MSIFSKTFRHGVHPKGNKELTMNLTSEVFPAPDLLYIPVQQHIGSPATPIVSVGDRVLMGQKIAEKSSPFSANIHASVSGIVKDIVLKDTSSGGKARHIVIENDRLYEEIRLPSLDNPSKDEIIDRVEEAGVVGMGGATFPLSIKLRPKTSVDTLIINGAECEPYITCDYRLMLESAENIVKGIRILMKALSVDRAIIGVEDNKKKGIESLRRYASDGIEVVPLRTKYPQGGEKQLVYALTGEIVPEGGLPADVGKVVVNITTAYTVYEAVVLGKTSYERMMTISGRAVASPKNLIVKVGTPYRALADYVGAADFAKVVSGGPMMGIAQVHLEVAVAKGTSSILFLRENDARSEEYGQCINCARCASACPMGLMPMYIDAYSLAGEYEKAKSYGAMLCIECGSCAYNCPAKRPLVQSIKLSKKIIKERNI